VVAHTRAHTGMRPARYSFLRPWPGYQRSVETWDALRARRNVRVFSNRPLSADHVDQILEAGRRTPSARNWQPWDFIVITGPERLAELSRVSPGAGYVSGAAATIALIVPTPDGERARDRTHYDLGQATMSIMVAAADLGIGSGHAGVADQLRARKVLGFPEDRFCPYLIALGYPADGPLVPIVRPDRHPFEEIVHREHW
jgi:nitroreductase